MKADFLSRASRLLLYVLFVLQFINLSKSGAQVVSAELSAIGFNGKIAIRASNAISYGAHFLPENGVVDLDFYFGEDDPRNGVHFGMPATQLNGEIFIRFLSLNYEQGDTLSFIVTEVLTGGTVYYFFKDGDYFPESGGTINTCPKRITCDPKAIYFHFDPSEVILTPSSFASLVVTIPNANISIERSNWAIDVNLNAIQLKYFSAPCEQILSGITLFAINGFTCTFVNGQLICTPWPDLPENISPFCAPFFDNCTINLVEIIEEAKYSIPCRQWKDYNMCSSGTLISRSGKVAIGTSNFSPDAKLTVRNGIITDRLKVTNKGWADYVFEPEYNIMTLSETQKYIALYNHLPGFPSAKAIEKEGSIEVGEITRLQQVKIEELFLHLIELDKEIKVLEALLFLNEIHEKTMPK